MTSHRPARRTMRDIFFAAAFAAGTAATGASPAFADARADLESGIAAMAAGNHTRAIALLSRAIEADTLAPENQAVAYNNRCAAFNLIDRPDRALTDCAWAIQLHPEMARAYVNRGIARRRLGRFDLAIEDYDRAIDLDPAFTAAYSNRAYAHYRALDFESAITDYRTAIDAREDMAVNHGGLGIALLANGRFAEAKEAFAAALAAAPDSPYWILWRDIATRRTGTADDKALRDAIDHFAPGVWPIAAARLMLGETTREGFLEATGADNDTTPPRLRCEALFFAAQQALATGDRAAAVDLYRRQIAIRATDICDPTVALADLRRFGVHLAPAARAAPAAPPPPSPPGR
jgi:tetratricopeptide (TPR) repeat protein